MTNRHVVSDAARGGQISSLRHQARRARGGRPSSVPERKQRQRLPAQLIKVHRKLDLGCSTHPGQSLPAPRSSAMNADYVLGKRSLRSAIQTACNGASPAAL